MILPCKLAYEATFFRIARPAIDMKKDVMWHNGVYKKFSWWKACLKPALSCHIMIQKGIRYKCTTKTEIKSRRLRICRLTPSSRCFVKCCSWNGESPLKLVSTTSVCIVQTSNESAVYRTYTERRHTKLCFHRLFHAATNRNTGDDNRHRTTQISSNRHGSWQQQHAGNEAKKSKKRYPTSEVRG